MYVEVFDDDNFRSEKLGWLTLSLKEYIRNPGLWLNQVKRNLIKIYNLIDKNNKES
jgi:hypothetical protein